MNRPENATCATCPFAHFNGEVSVGRCYGAPPGDTATLVRKDEFCGLHPIWQRAVTIALGNAMYNLTYVHPMKAGHCQTGESGIDLAADLFLQAMEQGHA